jgi:UPF0716 protein FxsA
MTRRIPWGVVGVLFVVVPLLEIYTVLQVGQVLGVWWTVLILVADSVLGAVLLKREGSNAWRALREALRAYRMPARELADGVLVLVGGTLLLTPGFVTDAAGFFLILPFTRPVARRALTTVITRKFLNTPAGPAAAHQGRARQRPGPDDVVRGDVVD